MYHSTNIILSKRRSQVKINEINFCVITTLLIINNKTRRKVFHKQVFIEQIMLRIYRLQHTAHVCNGKQTHIVIIFVTYIYFRVL